MKTAFPPNLISAASLGFSFFLYAKSFFENPLAPCDGKMPKAPDIFNPVLRFAVCSDIHTRNDRFSRMMQTCYALAEQSPLYQKLDAVLVCGDFTDCGAYEEMTRFAETLKESLHDGTQPILCIGNHEYFACKRNGETAHGSTEDKFRALFGVEPDSVYEINGFTFLAASYDPSGKHFFGKEKRDFYRTALQKARLRSREKPIFVLQHPHPVLTVYGSINWADVSTDLLWRRCPNVVNFSGHSHYPIGDPRSIWQGGYTALGTGSLKYFELENELQCGFNGEIPDASEQFYLVEADAKGSLLIRRYDLHAGSFFGDPLYIEKPADKKSFRYTYRNRKRSDRSLSFPDDALLSLTQNEKGEALLTFRSAEDTYEVHDYKYIVRDRFGKKVAGGSVLAQYFLPDRKKRYVTVSLGRCCKKGQTYTVSVYACNCYYQLSRPLKKQVVFGN